MNKNADDIVVLAQFEQNLTPLLVQAVDEPPDGLVADGPPVAQPEQFFQPGDFLLGLGFLLLQRSAAFIAHRQLTAGFLTPGMDL